MAADIKVRLTAEGVAEVVAALRRVQTQADQTASQGTKGFNLLSKSLGGVNNLLGQLGAAMSVGALAMFLKSASSAAENVKDFARGVGSGVENMSALNYVTAKTGTDLTSLQMPLGRFTKALTGLQAGVGANVKQFGLLKLSARDLMGKDTVESLALVSERFAKMKTDPRIAALSIDFFSRRGVALIEVMDELGAKGLVGVKKEAEAVGALFSGAMVDACDNLNATMRVLTLSAQVSAAGFLEGLSPAVVQTMLAITASAKTGETGLQDFGVGVGVVLKTVAFLFMGFFDTVGTILADLAILVVGTGRTVAAALRLDFGRAAREWVTADEAIRRNGDQYRAKMQKRWDVLTTPPPALGGVGGTEEPPSAEDMYRDRAVAQTAAADRELKLRQTQLKTLEAEEQRHYAQAMVTVGQYFTQRRELMRQGFDAEMKSLQTRREIAAANPDTQKAALETANIDAEIQRKAIENREAGIALTYEEVQAEERLARAVREGADRAREARGEEHASRLGQIDAEVKAYKDAVLTEGEAYRAAIAAGKSETEAVIAGLEDATARAADLRDALKAAAEATRASKAANVGMADYNLARGAILSRVDAGLMSEVRANKLLLELERDRLKVLLQMAEASLAAAEATGDPDRIMAARQFLQGVTDIGNEVERADNLGTQLGATVEDSMTAAFTDFFTNGINQAQTWGQEVRSVAASIIGALQALLGKMLAVYIMQKLLGFAGGGEATAAESGAPMTGDNPAFRAGGGRIFGPGGSRADRIPAWLSHGEYVVRAAVVGAPGVLDHLERLNAGLYVPGVRGYQGALRFAEGGLARAPGTSGPDGARVALTLGLEDGLVLRALKSPEGQRTLLNILSKNARAVGAAVSGRG